MENMDKYREMFEETGYEYCARKFDSLCECETKNEQDFMPCGWPTKDYLLDVMKHEWCERLANDMANDTDTAAPFYLMDEDLIEEMYLDGCRNFIKEQYDDGVDEEEIIEALMRGYKEAIAKRHNEQEESNMEIDVRVTVGELTNVFQLEVPRENWEKMLPELVNDVKWAIEEFETDVEDVNYDDCMSCMNEDGYWMDFETGEQGFVASHLLLANKMMSWMLQDLGVLEKLYEMVRDWLKETVPDSEECRMVESIKDMDRDICGITEEDYLPEIRVMIVEDQFPKQFLEEIFERLD